MVDLSFESYLDPDYYKEIIFDFPPRICGRDSKYRHFGLKMVLLHNLSLQQVSRVIEDLLEENGLEACTKNGKLKLLETLGVWGEIFIVGHLDQKLLILYEFMSTLKRHSWHRWTF